MMREGKEVGHKLFAALIRHGLGNDKMWLGDVLH